jgi:DUF4097 and DUF4098 domain-containing protein YvlB
MSKQTISTSLAPEIIIEQIGGNLQVKGWDEPEVVVQADPNTLHLEEQDDVVRINCDGNCEIRMPSGGAVQLNNAHGEARFRLLEDVLKIETVHGSLYLRNVAETTVETVHGELLARQVAGDLKVDHVHGNVMLRDVQGQCLLEQVQGNLDLRDVEGDVKVALQGNARLRLGAILGSQYEIQAEGNVHCRLPEDASIRVNLSSSGRMISVKMPDETKTYQQESYTFTLGEGAAVMNISAGGTIYLSVREMDWSEDEDQPANFDEFSRMQDDFSEQIARQVESQIEAQMEMMNRQLNQQMANLTASIGMAGVSAEETERIVRRARESSERAAAQAQEKVRRAQEKLERKLETTRRREEQHAQPGAHWGFRAGRGGWHVNFPPTPPAPTKEAVMDEERLAILRMLEQKKITLEEAESLLSALEGKES